MRIDDLSAPTRMFVSRVSAFVGTDDNRLGRAPFWPAADVFFTPVFAGPSGATPSNFPPRTPSPPSEPSEALPPTGGISTRTRRRTAKATCAAHPDVFYGFGPGSVPRKPSTRLDPPSRVSRPLKPLAAAPSASRSPTPVPTVPIPSDRDRAEPLGLPLLGFSIPVESPSAPTAVWTPSALLPNYTLVIPLRVFRTPTGRESNLQSLRATPPYNTFFSAGHWPCPPKS